MLAIPSSARTRERKIAAGTASTTPIDLLSVAVRDMPFGESKAVLVTAFGAGVPTCARRFRLRVSLRDADGRRQQNIRD